MSIGRYTTSLDGSFLSLVQAIGLQRSSRVTVGVAVTVGVLLGVDSKISSIDVCLLSISGTESGLDEFLVGLQCRLEFLDGDVVEELAFTKLAIWNSESLLSISGLPDIVSYELYVEKGRESDFWDFRKIVVFDEGLVDSLDSLGSDL
jgi:hypothetical protein